MPIVNCATSVFAGFSIFTVLGYLATLKDLDVSEVAAGGQYQSSSYSSIHLANFHRKIKYEYYSITFKINVR